MKKGLKALHILLVSISLLIISSTIWTRLTFGKIQVDSLLFTAKAPATGTDMTVVWSYILWCLLPVLLITILLIFIKMDKVKKGFIVITSDVLLLLISLIGFETYMKLITYAFTATKYTDIYENVDLYIDSDQVTLTNSSTNNLILIYLESYEVSYCDKQNGGGSDINYMKELTELAFNNQFFSNSDKLGGAKETGGTSFSIGAVTASQSGLPLNSCINKAMKKTDKYMPGALTLGDILENNNYIQEFAVACNSSFGYEDKFLKQHGNYNIIDLDYMKENYEYDKDDECPWGFLDEFLLEVSKDRITKIYEECLKTNKKFNFCIETMDTHTPKGFTCKNCPTTYDEQYKNVIACQSKQIAQFVKWCQEQPFYSNTTIVLVGDHKTMAESKIKFVDKNYQRVTYNCFINSKVSSTNNFNRDFTAMDYFPTILASIGFEIDNNQLGFGTNLFSDKQTVIEKKSLEYISKELEKKSNHNTKIYGIDIYK